MNRLLVKTAIMFVLGVGALAIGVAGRGDASSARTTVKAAFDRALGKTILVDSRGITLYAFTFDDQGKPACYVDDGSRCVPTWPSCVDDNEYHCIKEWPALTVRGKPGAVSGVRSSLLGVARRRDGRLQVTYRHHPLYYYVGGLGPPADKRPGDDNGQGFGGLWWVVSPTGTEIR
jgi:predicted lipoprotein with Yx(FWY)xxD motif